jgi:hypothetical protein
MNYYIGFLINNPNDIFFENNINTYYFYMNFKNENKNILDITENEFSKFSNILNVDENSIIVTYDKLYDDFNLTEYNDVNYNEIIHIFVLIFRIFNSKNKSIQGSFNNSRYLEMYNIDLITNNEPQLLLRTGIIEMHALNSFLNNDKEIIKNSIEIIINSNNDDMYLTKKKCWIVTYKDIDSVVSYFKNLMTNAGFYINNDKDKSFICLEYFCNEYKNAILNCDYLFNWSFLNCFSLDLINEKKKGKKIKYFNINDSSIYKLLNNKNILFLTPYKNQIDNIYKSGRIYKLKISINLENINLYTIEAFLTTYPNKKHEDFIETVNYYFKSIDEIINNNQINLFTCSAGGYGLILCNYVYSK